MVPDRWLGPAAGGVDPALVGSKQQPSGAGRVPRERDIQALGEKRPYKIDLRNVNQRI